MGSGTGHTYASAKKFDTNLEKTIVSQKGGPGRRLARHLLHLRLHAHTCCRLILGTPFGRQDCTDEPEEGNEDPDDPKQNVSFAESEHTHGEKTEKVDAEKEGCKNPIKYCHVIKLLTSVESSTCRSEQVM